MTKKPEIRVLLVDDDAEDIKLLSVYLQKIGRQFYPAEGVRDYDAALEEIAKDRHDIYLVDYRLGTENGVELIRAAIANGCTKPIILLTGRGDHKVDIEAMEAGAVDYLSKDGITPEQLERAIRYSISQREMQNSLRKANDALEQRVTERTVELRQSEAGLLEILENSPFGVSIISLAEKKRLYVNRRYIEMFTAERSGAENIDYNSDNNFLEQNLADSFVDPNNLKRNWAIFERDGYVEGSQEQRVRMDGSTWWCLADWRGLTFGGEPAMMGWHYDITLRKQAEDELHKNTELANLLRATATFAIKSTDFDQFVHTCISTVSKFAAWPIGHAYMLSEEDDNLLVPSGIWHMEDSKRFENFVEITNKTTFKRGVGLPGRVLETGEPEWIFDVTGDENFPRAKLCHDIGIHGAFAFPVWAGKQVVAVLEFFDEKAHEPDKTLLANVVHIGNQLGRVFERNRAESELRKAMEKIDIANRDLEEKIQERTQKLRAAIVEAENANSAKTEFLANMSHELRTPLNAIIGFSRMIEGAMFGPVGSRYLEYAQHINVSGEHLLGIISDILDISKVEAGKLKVEKEDVDMSETTAACKIMVAGRAEEAGVILRFEVAADLPLLYADPLRLKQILLNLLTNAIKFTPNGNQITVSVDKKIDGWVTLTVCDTGIGIAKDDIPKVLEKFDQVRDGHMRSHEGAGLGLALTKSLVELHGGTLEIESEVGKGTIVRVTFPPKSIDRLSARN